SIPLNYTLFDLEVYKDADKDYATPAYPYAPINAVTFYNSWDQSIRTYVLALDRSADEIREQLAGDFDEFGEMTESNGFFVFTDEISMLSRFLSDIRDTDVLSGWNSEDFDIPYLVNRILWLLAERYEVLITFPLDTSPDKVREYLDRIIEADNDASPAPLYLLQRVNYPSLDKPPEPKTVVKYGKDVITYELLGRVHLDYLELYKKFTYEELHSYSLDSVLSHEVGQNKVPYEGTLDDLYRNDIRRFTAYSRQDVAGLVDLDNKLGFINLTDTMARFGLVNLEKVLGTVALVQGAIHRKAHQHGKVVPDKRNALRVAEEYDGMAAPGAIVFDPIPGIHEWVASYDVNSLYPTTIRMLNLSYETIGGIVLPDRIDRDEGKKRGWADFWSDYLQIPEVTLINSGSDETVRVLFPNPDAFTITDTFVVEEIPAKNILDLVDSDPNLLLTPFGLIVDRTITGIIPELLGEWYEGRKKMRKMESEYFKKAQEEQDPAKKKEYMQKYEYFSTMQMVRKILLNSTYGSILNEHCAYYMFPVGSSVTMSGRAVVYSMKEIAEELLDAGLDTIREMAG
ncbi:MAG: hypothetical protein D6698_09270, partial [Gammaproteobacteria bacterium]